LSIYIVKGRWPHSFSQGCSSLEGVGLRLLRRLDIFWYWRRVFFYGRGNVFERSLALRLTRSIWCTIALRLRLKAQGWVWVDLRGRISCCTLCCRCLEEAWDSGFLGCGGSLRRYSIWLSKWRGVRASIKKGFTSWINMIVDLLRFYCFAADRARNHTECDSEYSDVVSSNWISRRGFSGRRVALRPFRLQ